MIKCNQCGFLLMIADALLSTFVIFPLAVLHWEGTWVLQDEFFLPTNNGASTLLSLSVGAVVCTMQLLMQPQLAEWLLKQPPLLYFFITRLHLYVHGWAILCYWRGVWNLLDLFFNSNHPFFHHIVLVVYLVCQSLMVLFRTVRTTIGPPVSINLDFSDDLLDADLIFKVHHRNPLLFTLDCLFTQFVIVTLSLTIWWALWWFYDMVLFTDPSQDPLCCFLGGSISFFFLLIQVPLSSISKRLDNRFWCKVAYEDVIFIILTWANLMFWRGFWNLWVEDFMDRKWVGVWFSHVVGTLGLLLLQSLNSTGQHGIDRDGSYPGGTGIFPNKLLTVVFHKHLSQYKSVGRDDDDDGGSGSGGFTDDDGDDGGGGGSSLDSTINGSSFYNYISLNTKINPSPTTPTSPTTQHPTLNNNNDKLDVSKSESDVDNMTDSQLQTSSDATNTSSLPKNALPCSEVLVNISNYSNHINNNNNNNNINNNNINNNNNDDNNIINNITNNNNSNINNNNNINNNTIINERDNIDFGDVEANRNKVDSNSDAVT